MSRTKPIADQLRQAIRRAERQGVTRYQIAQRSGVSQAMLSKFMAGTGDVKAETARKVAEAIGYRLILERS